VLDQSQNMRVPQVSSNLSKPALLEMHPLLVAGIDLVGSIIGVRYQCKVFFLQFCNKSGDLPEQELLAKFGYTSERKVNFFKNPVVVNPFL
jgi:hypothetical protein